MAKMIYVQLWPSLVVVTEEYDPIGKNFPCERCNHSPNWHRCYDSLNEYPKFPCTGANFTGCADKCPDFMPPIGYLEWIEDSA